MVKKKVKSEMFDRFFETKYIKKLFFHSLEKNYKDGKRGVLLVSLLISVELFMVYYILKSNNGYSDEYLNTIICINGDKALEIFLSQLSLSFITISLTSILSDKSVVIYWENVTEKKLISPKWFCFYSFVIYCIVCSISSGIALLLNQYGLVLLFFGINVCVLFSLTIRITDIFFNREKEKIRLSKYYVSTFGQMGKTKSYVEKDLPTFEKKIINNERDLITKMEANTYKAFVNNDFDTLYENISFILKDLGVFGKHIVYSTMNENTYQIILTAVSDVISQFANYKGEISFYDQNNRDLISEIIDSPRIFDIGFSILISDKSELELLKYYKVKRQLYFMQNLSKDSKYFKAFVMDYLPRYIFENMNEDEFNKADYRMVYENYLKKQVDDMLDILEIKSLNSDTFIQLQQVVYDAIIDDMIELLRYDIGAEKILDSINSDYLPYSLKQRNIEFSRV